MRSLCVPCAIVERNPLGFLFLYHPCRMASWEPFTSALHGWFATSLIRHREPLDLKTLPLTRSTNADQDCVACTGLDTTKGQAALHILNHAMLLSRKAIVPGAADNSDLVGRLKPE